LVPLAPRPPSRSTTVSPQKKITTVVLSFIFKRLGNAVILAMDRYKPRVMSAEAESDWQLGWLRATAYGEYAKYVYEVGWLWQTIEVEIVKPDFLTPEGPLVPGFYINSATTNAELDEIATLFEVRLAFTNVLIACAQDNYRDRYRILWNRLSMTLASEDEWAECIVRNELWHQMYLTVAQIKEQFRFARQAAAMLDNDVTYNRLARSWLVADRAVGRFSTWEREREFL
jgi:hypothetical protein